MQIKICSLVLTVVAFFMTASTHVSADQQPDTAFINGFLAGAILTDEEIVSWFKELSPKGRSDFEKRALRTRMARKSIALPPTYYAGFCLPSEKRTSLIVNNVKDYLSKNSMADNLSAGDKVYAAVKNLYPCLQKQGGKK